MSTKKVLDEINKKIEQFEEEQKRFTLAGFRRMRKLSLELTKLFKEFRKISPKDSDELKKFKDSL